MNKTIGCALAAFASLASLAADLVYDWKSDEHPTSILGGKVALTYDANDKIVSMEASPDADERIVFTGDAMTFGDAFVTNLTAGTIVFSNEVAVNSMAVRVANAVDSVRTYVGYANFIGTDPVTVIPSADLDDWKPVTVSMTKTDERGQTITDWANPNRMLMTALKRYPGRVTFQLQTASAVDAVSGLYLSKCVRLELVQDGADVKARTFSPTYQVVSDASFDNYYDIDEVLAGRVSGVTAVEYPLRTTDDANNGYGINTLEFNRIGVTPAETVFFCGGVSCADVMNPGSGTLVAVDAQTSGAAELNVQTSGSTGALAFRDGSMDWQGQYLSGGGKVVFEATRGVGGELYSDKTEDFWFVTNTPTKVASGRRLSDLLICTNRAWVTSAPDGVHVNPALDADKNFSWGYISGSFVNGVADLDNANNVRHPANFYNLKFGDDAQTNATVQVQCQQKNTLRCVYLDLVENGGDIYASVTAQAACYCDVTNEAMRTDSKKRFEYDTLLGVDFDIPKGFAPANRKKYQVTIDQQTAYSTTNRTFGIRGLNLLFKSPAAYVVSSSKPCLTKTAGAEYVIAGLDKPRMALSVTDMGAFPTNGVVTVKAGGELWLDGKWSNAQIGQENGISGETCSLRVRKGGVIRQRCYNPFGATQDILVDGGSIVFEGIAGLTNYLGCYFNTVTLANGASLVGSGNLRFNVGFKSNPAWTITGTAPSTNDVPMTMVAGNSKNALRTFTIDVGETGDPVADFVNNGEIQLYSDMNQTNVLVRKTGEGTMLQNAAYTHSGALEVLGGTFKFGGSELWTSKSGITVDGATVAAADGTANTLGTLAVGIGGATIEIGAGASLAFADSAALDWSGPVEITFDGELTGSQIRFGTDADGLTEMQKRKLRHNGSRVTLDENGGAYDYVPGMVIMFR